MFRSSRNTVRFSIVQAHRRHFHVTPTSSALLGLVAGDMSRSGFGQPALVPADVATLVRAGHQVLVDGKLANLLPGKYEAAGAHVTEQVETRICDVVASVAAPTIEDVEARADRPQVAPAKPTVFVSYFRLEQQKDQGLQSAMFKCFEERGARFVETSKLPGNFTVIGGPIKTCLASEIGAAAMQDGLDGLKTMCRIRGMQGRVDTLDCGAGKVVRKIKKGKSIIIAIAGDTGAARGAQAALAERFNVQWIKASELRARSAVTSHSPKVYACMLEPEDYLVGPNGSFDRDLYDLRPELFTSYFHIAPYVTLFCNAAYARSGSPSLLPPAAAASLLFRDCENLFLTVDVESGLRADLASLSQPSAGGTCALPTPAGNVAKTLYWNPNTGQQRTFNLRRLADFTPLDVLEQRSRMLLPYIHSLLGRAMPTSSGSSTVAPKLEGARARKAKEAGTLRALSRAELAPQFVGTSGRLRPTVYAVLLLLGLCQGLVEEQGCAVACPYDDTTRHAIDKAFEAGLRYALLLVE